MPRMPQRTRITRTVSKERPKKPRGVKTGTTRGPYSTSRIKDPLAKPWLKPPVYARFCDAPEHLRARALEKRPWVARYVNDGRPRGKLPLYIAEYALAAAIPQEKIPTYQTIYRWAVRMYVFGDVGLLDSPPALAGKPKIVGWKEEVGEDGTPEPKPIYSISAAQEELVHTGLVGGQLNYTGLIGFLVDHSPAGEKVPSYDVIRAAAQRFERDNPHLMTIARSGTVGHRDRERLSLAHGVLPGGYCISIDSTVADLWVRIEDAARPEGWKAVRPVLSVVMDVGSRALLAYNLSLHAVDSGIIKAVFRRAILQEANDEAGYPDLLAAELLPEQVLVDKGAEHQAQFRDLLKKLDVDVVVRNDNEPTGSAHVESLIGVITKEVFAGLQGYSPKQTVFDAYAPREEEARRSLKDLKYDSYKAQWPVRDLLSLDELDAAIYGWATHYNQRPHPGLRAEDPAIQQVIAQYYRSSTNLITEAA